jgi:DNA-directed RNA polymerase specialized sigma24 family protein
MEGARRFFLSDDVVQQACAGSEEAWCEIYAAAKPFILGLCRGAHGLSPEDSQDICQNIILQLYRTLDRVENVGAWIHGAVRRQAGGVRMKAPAGAFGIQPEDAAAPGGENGVEESIHFWHAFSCLSSTCRRIFHHLIFEGLSHREAAPIIGIPPGTVYHMKAKCQENFLHFFNGGPHEG